MDAKRIFPPIWPTEAADRRAWIQRKMGSPEDRKRWQQRAEDLDRLAHKGQASLWDGGKAA